MSEKVRTQHLECKAILYVRQSSPYQVIHNLESQKLQYEMEARLRQLGWREIEVIDEDLGRSAAGAVTRAGFERMVAEVCLGQVGAVAAGGAAALVPGFRAAMQRTNPTHAVRASARAANRCSRSCARCFFLHQTQARVVPRKYIENASAAVVNGVIVGSAFAVRALNGSR